MFNPQLFFERGLAPSVLYGVPYFNSDRIYIGFSTRFGNIVVYKPDGSVHLNYGCPRKVDMTNGGAGGSSVFTPSLLLASPFTGDIYLRFLKGFRDVYSIGINTLRTVDSVNKLNIDIETFFKPFYNCFSIFIRDVSNGNSLIASNIKGNLAKFPNSIEVISIEICETISGGSDLVIDLNSFDVNSKLRIFRLGYSYGNVYTTKAKLIGDIANLPPNIQTFFQNAAVTHSTSSFTYTPGRVWRPDFGGITVGKAFAPNGSLTAIQQNDNLFIDINNSVTTAVDIKRIGVIGGRTSLSNAAVTSLQAKGFTCTW